MRRLVLMLVSRRGASAEDAAAVLSAVATPLKAIANVRRLEVRSGCRLAADPLAAAAEAMGRAITPVSALLQVSGPSSTPVDELIDLVRSADGLADAFDLASSAAALGVVKQITASPSRRIVLVVGTRKLATVSENEFHTHWGETHASLALSLMPAGAAERIGYEQLHASSEDSCRAARAAGVGVADLAGVLQVFCREPADFLTVAAEPTFAARIYEDEKSFADQTAMRGGFIAL